MMLNARVTPGASLMTLKVGRNRPDFFARLCVRHQAPTGGGVTKIAYYQRRDLWSVRVRYGVTVSRANASPASSDAVDAVATHLRTARRRGTEIRLAEEFATMMCVRRKAPRRNVLGAYDC
eukprot:7150121-Prymnesium_polylepis.2